MAQLQSRKVKIGLIIAAVVCVAAAVTGLVVGLASKGDDEPHAHQSDRPHAHQSDKPHHQSDGKLDLAVQQAGLLGLVNCEGVGSFEELPIVQCKDATLSQTYEADIPTTIVVPKFKIDALSESYIEQKAKDLGYTECEDTLTIDELGTTNCKEGGLMFLPADLEAGRRRASPQATTTLTPVQKPEAQKARPESRPESDAQMCCKAMTANCLSCSAVMSEKDYCRANPLTTGCPKPVTPKPLNPNPLVPTPVLAPMKPCCMAMTANCLACSASMTEKDYCQRHPGTPGCPQAEGLKRDPVPSPPAPSYNWRTAEWTECISRKQSRVVQCEEAGGAVVSNRMCTAVKPASEQSCESTQPSRPEPVFLLEYDLDGVSDSQTVTSKGRATSVVGSHYGNGKSDSHGGITVPIHRKPEYFKFDVPSPTAAAHFVVVFKHLAGWPPFHLNFIIYPVGGIAAGWYGNQNKDGNYRNFVAGAGSENINFKSIKPKDNAIYIYDLKKTSTKYTVTMHRYDESGWISETSPEISSRTVLTMFDTRGFKDHHGRRHDNHYANQCMCAVYYNPTVVSESLYLPALKRRWERFSQLGPV